MSIRLLVDQTGGGRTDLCDRPPELVSKGVSGSQPQYPPNSFSYSNPSVPSAITTLDPFTPNFASVGVGVADAEAEADVREADTREDDSAGVKAEIGLVDELELILATRERGGEG